MAKQETFTNIIAEVDRAWRKDLYAYARAKRQIYLDYATFIAPTSYDEEQVFRRLAFSILSVQSPFERGAGAFARVCALSWDARQNMGKVRDAIDDLIYLDVKSKGIARLAMDIRADLEPFLRAENEEWHLYRRRLESLVHGLGKAKSSFAACLLYPLDADLACLDTWMLRHFRIDETLNGRLSWETYLAVEKYIRRYARAWKVSTFIAQWIVWDHERGSEESHAAVTLPGGHK